MRTGLIGKKIGSSSYFNEDGSVSPITIVKVEECIVSQVKTKDKDGYDAIQLASIEDKLKISKINKPQRKIFTSINIKPKRVLKEFRVKEDNLLEIGTKLDVSHFQKDQIVDVTGVSIGKGFAGSMKRHNFAGLRASHGVSISHRAHGSTGNCQDPGRVFKGKKMAGHMGAKKVTKHNLKIIDIDENNKIISIKGSIPGKNNSVVFIKDAIKKK
ncbi:MAG: 50S ribosomal protein L3 [Alphaproteobacteria bacterium MarineAlpha5_Bin8]|nr:MAG: 50S ribosomal protein L3 [Alphaproteobacteria bacterium MarineAlpha5_Bin7]PPR48076.1 MAG: 50S ribosomal protein L3 [Alphaproteobacteria bacterium MarineAlpha5_Bin8]PPR54045.1 MAG: 50S ribosomal protein L3 [Alphaproteobacteria bacterium MarineAlpha5_Bin6]|tara:strand:- start:836 stop:1477 length:642 start_codon:yes stop_codon:yes gene_type:complete